MSAFLAPLLLSVLGLVMDYGSLTLQKRRMQMAADMAAIVAASAPNNALDAAKAYMIDNGYRASVEIADATNAVVNKDRVNSELRKGNRDGVVVINLGQYAADPKTAVKDRFTATSASTNAVQVTIYQAGDLLFTSSFYSPPLLKVSGIAANQNEAAISIGSRIASVHDGVLNGMLTALVGSTVDLDVMDYNALATAQIDLLQMSQSLATQLRQVINTRRLLTNFPPF